MVDIAMRLLIVAVAVPVVLAVTWRLLKEAARNE